MARRKRGNPVSGWLIVDKPAGVTSTSVVNKVRWALEAQKAGHAGTLDPDATGLLAVALGETTKTIPVVMDALKTYTFTVTWGASTSTDDASGAVLETSDLRPDDPSIIEALEQFRGEISQTPPQVSAVKVDGARAYDLAREGAVLDLKARSLWVDALDLVGTSRKDEADFEMTCGKGGYVRSIARDLGAVLGCLGHVKHLRRTRSGPFEVNGAITWPEIEALERTPELLARLTPTEAGLADTPQCTCSAEAAAQVRNGATVEVLSSTADQGEDAWLSHQGKAIAMGSYLAGRFRPSRVLNVE